jgi:NTP pyrophosphatase (non-canonical NTP hydrolase)
MNCQPELQARIDRAECRYSAFASTHEALGVCLEEWHELIEQVRANDMPGIREEALDLAATLIRLADSVHTLTERSRK